jgi:hypothetical protein
MTLLTVPPVEEMLWKVSPPAPMVVLVTLSAVATPVAMVLVPVLVTEPPSSRTMPAPGLPALLMATSPMTSAPTSALPVTDVPSVERARP